jgi:hypothetical protein
MTWSDAIGAALAERGWTCSVVEVATGGSVAALFGDVPWLRLAETLAEDAPTAVHCRMPAPPANAAASSAPAPGSPKGRGARRNPRCRRQRRRPGRTGSGPGDDSAVAVVVIPGSYTASAGWRSSGSHRQQLCEQVLVEWLLEQFRNA